MTLKTQKHLLFVLVSYVLVALLEYRRARKYGAGTSPSFRFGVLWPYYELSGALTRVTNAPKFSQPLASYAFTASGFTPQSATARAEAGGKLESAVPEQFVPGGSGVSGGGATGSY